MTLMTSIRRPGRVLAVLGVLAWLASAPAWAASCNLSMANLSFGAYVGSQIQSSSSASLTCNKTSPGPSAEKIDYWVSLSTGAGSYLQRQMTRTALPADTLPYNLYLNTLPAVLNTSVWGDGTGTTVRWSGTMSLPSGGGGNPPRTDTATLVGAIPAGYFPSAGTYQDTIVATLIIL